MGADGRMMPWTCFKCSECGVGKKPEDMALFRSKVDRVLKGTYVCGDCTRKTQKVAAPALELQRAKFNLALGPYFGQGRNTNGAEVKFMIRLIKDGRCCLECAPAGDANPSLTWVV